ASAIAGANQRTDASSRNHIDGNSSGFQRAEYADMRDAARESAGECKPDATRCGRSGFFTDSERTQLIFRVLEPIDRVGNFVVQHTAFILVPPSCADTWFDRRMPVL